MKLSKQLLEAINRGIKFALSDLEDDEELSAISKLKTGLIEDSNYTRELLDLKKETIDLGLPSGTLWCKYNLDVNPNLLSKPEDWYGKYYAWGELKPNKPEFTWSTYKHSEHYTYLNEKECITKYCNNPQKGYNQITKTHGFADNLTLLLPEDDAAYLNKKLYNFKFRIPTKAQCEELINYTNTYWVKNYDPNKIIHNPKDDGGIKGLNGRVFVGKNANLMFIPAAGYRYNFNNGNVGSSCYLWSSSLYLSNSGDAYFLYFDSADINIGSNLRYDGYSVRPVINL